ncbi:hypothetical protein MLD38_029409 [Melastoma candidum]|uniref:Uncharacterized protein n=1 Tax=Melastoma candidum TaxID=119954 RepID=A0ACB9N5D3_9MYRT|nr:hypothetical protein MLD38_029409 [Melastoma candidum]
MVLMQLCWSISRAIQQMSNAASSTRKSSMIASSATCRTTSRILSTSLTLPPVTTHTPDHPADVLVSAPKMSALIRMMGRAISNELCKMLDPGKPSFTPKKRKTSVVIAEAFDGLKQNTKAKIPFYGSFHGGCGEWRHLRKKTDLIIVDTSDRQKQEAALLEEMRQVSEATVMSWLKTSSPEEMLL